MYEFASSSEDKLPRVTIGDSSVEGSGWTWQDGWQGLVPSKSTLADAKAILGEISGASELANGITYDFIGGLIRISFIDGNESIVKIRVDCHSPKPFNAPPNIGEAEKTYGKLLAIAVNRHEGAICERPGLRICFDAMQESSPIKWIDIYKPL